MDLIQYESALNNFIGSEEFASLDDASQQERIKGIRDAYLDQNRDTSIEDVDSITENSNKRFLRGTGRGRAIPTLDNIIFPNQEAGFNDLTLTEKNAKLEEFRNKIPELAKQNPTQREDTEYFLKQSIGELDRRVNGEGKGRIRSMASSLGEGFLATLAESVGATDTADGIRSYFTENPEYDGEFFTNQLFQGVGSGFASVAIIAGLAFTTKGLGGTAAAAEAIGTTGSLLTNGIMRYNEGYKNAIDAGLDEDKASEAGWAATPAATIDALSDRILASGIMPAHVNKVFSSGSVVEKRAMMASLMGEQSAKGRLFDYAKTALGEGLSESAGDYAAAYGPYLVTDNDKYLPTAKESLNSFLLGAVIGGGMTAGFDLPNTVGGKQGQTRIVDGKKVTESYATKTQRNLAETQINLDELKDKDGTNQIFTLLSQGNYKGAYQLSTEILKKQSDVQKAEEELQAAKQEEQKEPAVTGLQSNNTVENGRYESPPDSGKYTNPAPETGKFTIQPDETGRYQNPPDTGKYADKPAKAPSQENNIIEPTKVQSFKTSSGSIYQVGEKGVVTTTVQAGDNKNNINFPKESKTFYASKDDVPRISGAIQNQDAPTNVEDLNNGTISIAPKETQDGKQAANAVSVNVEDSPKIDLTPITVWNDESGNQQVHIGDPIVETFNSPSAKTENKTDAVEPTAVEKADINTNAAPVSKYSNVKSSGKYGPRPVSERVAEAEAKLQRANDDLRRIISGAPEEWQEQLRANQAVAQAAEMRENTVMDQGAFFAVQADRFKGKFKKAFDRMVQDVQAKTPDLQFMYVPELTELGAEALYDPNKNIIMFRDAKPSLRALAHETTHALTVGDLNAFINNRSEATYSGKLLAAAMDEATPEYLRNLIKVYNHATIELGMQGVSGQIITDQNLADSKNFTDAEYAFTNIEEFVAEAVSNRQFQDLISQIPYEGKSIWNHIVDIFKNAWSWISDVGGAEFVMRNNGDNVLSATLGLVNYGMYQENNINEATSKNNINFLPSEVSESNILRFVKVGIATQNGNVTQIGKISIAKDGLINENRLLSASQMNRQVFDLIKEVYPEAWTGENVDINKLIQLEKDRPLFETHVYGQSGKETPAKAKFDEAVGELDRLGFKLGTNGRLARHGSDMTWDDNNPNITSEVRKWYNQAKATRDEAKQASGLKATHYYNTISPFDTTKYPVVRVDVTVPGTPKDIWEVVDGNGKQLSYYNEGQSAPMTSEQLANRWVEYNRRSYPDAKAVKGKTNTLWEPDDLHENLPNTLGWAMVQFVPDPRTGETVMFVAEQQSRWGQTKQRELKDKKRLEAIDRERGYQAMSHGQTADHPLLDHQHKLVLKAAMEEARKRGVTKMVVSDGETAMMTERHDAQWVPEGQQPSQSGGMRQHYDSVLQSAAEKMTKSKGEVVDMGPHKNADPSQTEGGHPADPKGSPVFRNPDGTPKATATGMMYDISPSVINNINYLPGQTPAKRDKTFYRQLASIVSGNINDKADVATHKIISILADMNPSDIMKIDDEAKDYLSVIVSNIYNARKSAVMNPQMRVDSDLVISHLEAIKTIVDQNAVRKIYDDYDGIVDFGDLDPNFADDKEELKRYANEYMERRGLVDLMENASKKQKSAERYAKIQAKWRAEFDRIREAVIERFADAENYISETESLLGANFEDPYLRDFIKIHFGYLTNLDVSQMQGRELYQHFFAINNMIDGSFRFKPTVEFLAKQRNKEEVISSLKDTFRDPVINSSKFMQWVDEVNQFAELHQVQLQRLSALEGTRDFLQNKLLIGLHDAIMTTSYNRKIQYTREFVEAKNNIMEGLDRDLDKEGNVELNTEDRVITSIMGRLVQFAVGENPDVALVRNIKKERKSIQNIIHNSTSVENVKLHKARVQFIFDEMVTGLEAYGPGAMAHLIETSAARMAGTEGVAAGDARLQLLSKAQEIFSRFNAESKAVSEGFFNKPFKKYVNYMSNEVMSTDAASKSEWKINESVYGLDEADHKISIRSEAAHLKERQAGLGDHDSYSYNLEGTFYRNVEKICVDNGTISERQIIAERLRPGSELNNIISLSGGVDVPHQGRVAAINGMIVRIMSNATSKGQPLDFGTQMLRGLTGMYAKATLSSVHHIVTQPIAAAIDYSLRTGNISGWLRAALYVASNHDKVNAWLEKNQMWTRERSITESMGLDQRRSPKDDSEGSIKNNPAVKYLSKYYDKAAQVMTFFIHQGDNFAVKATLLAEYERLLTRKYGKEFTSLDDIDFNTEERRILTEATLNAEKNINTSNKILRGELFTDRRITTTLVRNLLFAFSAHQASLATQLNQAVRDLKELKSMNAPAKEMEAKIRTISAITMQQAGFTTARFAVAGLTARLMIGLVSDLFDDEEGKISDLETALRVAQKKGNPIKIAQAENELANAQSVRKVITQMKYQTQSADSLFKQVMRDSIGSFHISFNMGAMQQALAFIPDAFQGRVAKEGQEREVQELRKQITIAKDAKNEKLVGKLTEQLTVLEAMDYIPYAYPNAGGIGLSGIYGATLDTYKRATTEISQAVMGVNEWNYTDFVIDAATLGVGQSEFTKTMNFIDKIEDEHWKQNKTYQEQKLPAAKKKEATQKRRLPSTNIPGLKLPNI